MKHTWVLDKNYNFMKYLIFNVLHQNLKIINSRYSIILSLMLLQLFSVECNVDSTTKKSTEQNG